MRHGEGCEKIARALHRLGTRRHKDRGQPAVHAPAQAQARGRGSASGRELGLELGEILLHSDRMTFSLCRPCCPLSRAAREHPKATQQAPVRLRAALHTVRVQLCSHAIQRGARCGARADAARQKAIPQVTDLELAVRAKPILGLGDLLLADRPRNYGRVSTGT
jgi:hypothetical protein